MTQLHSLIRRISRYRFICVGLLALIVVLTTAGADELMAAERMGCGFAPDVSGLDPLIKGDNDYGFLDDLMQRVVLFLKAVAHRVAQVICVIINEFGVDCRP